MRLEIPLFHWRWKVAGLLLTLLGLALLYLYFTGHKPQWLYFPTWAIASFYSERSYFSSIQTNIIDEIGALTIVFGLLLSFFSREKREEHGEFNPLRIKALLRSLWVVAILWSLAFVLVYGVAIFFVAATFFPLYLLLCNLDYYLQLLILRRKAALH